MHFKRFIRGVIGKPVVVAKTRVYAAFLARCATRDLVRQTQNRRLNAAMRAIDGSNYALKLGLNVGVDPSAFARMLPIDGYERISPYVERVMRGETSALFRAGTKIAMFAMTSGTTAPVKYIPVTTEGMREYQESWTVWGIALSRQHPEIPFGTIINLASSWRQSLTPSGIPCGSITGLLFKHMHRLLRLLHAVPPEVALVADSGLRAYLIWRLALARLDTRMITTANPSTLIAFARVLAANSEHLLRDLADGSLQNEADYAPEVLRAVRLQIKRRHRERVRELELLAKISELTPSRVFPHLELIAVWTGGTLSSYLARLPEFYGYATMRDHGLSASEGRLTIPLNDGCSDGVLNISGPYFEFVPAEVTDRNKSRSYRADELDIGAKYSVVITTTGGLIRYDMSDVVECTGRVGAAPLLRFLNKGSQFSNLTGEKLSAFQIVSAVNVSLNGTGPSEWVIAPKPGDPAGYEWLMEVDAVIALGMQKQKVVYELDRQLMAHNVEYADKRNSHRLAPIRLVPLQNGAFTQLRQARLAMSHAPVEQYKHPFLLTDPHFLSLLEKLRMREEDGGTH